MKTKLNEPEVRAEMDSYIAKMKTLTIIKGVLMAVFDILVPILFFVFILVVWSNYIQSFIQEEANLVTPCSLLLSVAIAIDLAFSIYSK